MDRPGPLTTILRGRTFPSEAYAAYSRIIAYAASAPETTERLKVSMVSVNALPGFMHTPLYRSSGMNLDGVELPLRRGDSKFVAQRDTDTGNMLQALRRKTVDVEVLFWEFLIREPVVCMPGQIRRMLSLAEEFPNLKLHMIEWQNWRKAYGLTVDRTILRSPTVWTTPFDLTITNAAFDAETQLPVMEIVTTRPLVDQFNVWRDELTLSHGDTLAALQASLN